MHRFHTVIRCALVVALLCGLVSIAAADGEGSTFTAYNIWYENPAKLYSTNYQKGAIVPAGTAVENVRAKGKTITFTDSETGATYTVIFYSKHHPGWKITDMRDKMFTSDYKALTAGFTADELAAIKEGTVREGMSREAVLVAVGYPPQVATPTLESKAWKYWAHRFRTYLVHFGDDGRVKSVQN